jgi:hypothetical protein
VVVMNVYRYTKASGEMISGLTQRRTTESSSTGSASSRRTRGRWPWRARGVTS